MNDETTTTAVALPAGYDDAGSFWYVKPEHRAEYVKITDDDLRVAAKYKFPDLRSALSETLKEQAREALRAAKLSEYVKKYGGTEAQALKYIGTVRGTVALTADEHMKIDEDYTVGTGFEWPQDAEARVRHLYRRGTAVDVVNHAERARQRTESLRCAMCNRPTPAGRLDVVYPLDKLVSHNVAGISRGPGLRCCDGCVDVIRNEAAALRGALLVEGDESATVRDRARELIAAYVPLLAPADASAPTVDSAAALLARVAATR